MPHTLKIKSGSVRLNNRAFVAGQEDELAKVITPEQHEYLKRRGVLLGDLHVEGDGSQLTPEQEEALKAEADARAEELRQREAAAIKDAMAEDEARQRQAQMDALVKRLSDVVDSKGVQVTGGDQALVRTITDEPEQPSTPATSESPAPVGEQEAQRLVEQSPTVTEPVQTSTTEQPATTAEAPAAADATTPVDPAAQKKADAAKRVAAHRAKAKAAKEAVKEAAKATAEQK